MSEHQGVVKPPGSVPAVEVSAGRSTSMALLVGPDDGAPGFALRKFSMAAGGGMPLHRNDVEHEQFVLRGRGRVTIGGDAFDVGPGHALLIPAGVPHRYEVLEAPFEFLCIVPNRPDRIEILEEE